MLLSSFTILKLKWYNSNPQSEHSIKHFHTHIDGVFANSVYNKYNHSFIITTQTNTSTNKHTHIHSHTYKCRDTDPNPNIKLTVQCTYLRQNCANQFYMYECRWYTRMVIASVLVNKEEKSNRNRKSTEVLKTTEIHLQKKKMEKIKKMLCLSK